MLLDLALIVQTLSISLGVGSSTLAIVNFFVAIADGKIDEHERRMMGVVYKVLRVAMAGILISTLCVFVLSYVKVPQFEALQLQIASLLVVLCINAVLMTLRKMPSAFGPAIQVSAWYSTGFLIAFDRVMWNLSYLQFVIFYLVMFTLAVSVINGLMMHLKQKQKSAVQTAQPTQAS